MKKSTLFRYAIAALALSAASFFTLWNVNEIDKYARQYLAPALGKDLMIIVSVLGVFLPPSLLFALCLRGLLRIFRVTPFENGSTFKWRDWP